MSKEKKKIDNPALFVVVFVLFLVSIIVLVVGVLRGRNENQLGLSPGNASKKVKEEEENSISDYFKDDFAKNSGNKDDFLDSDPFKEVCASTSGDDIPSITFGTVCMR